MKRRVVIRPIADQDIDREALQIASYSGMDAGLRFYEACDRAFALLLTQPRLGVIRDFDLPLLTGMRMWKLKGFEDYLIFYRPIEAGIEVLKVIHGSRDLPTLFAEEFLEDET